MGWLLESNPLQNKNNNKRVKYNDLAQNGMACNGLQQNEMLITKCEMRLFGPGWNGLEQNGRHGKGESCG